jgi:hypothetical protein
MIHQNGALFPWIAPTLTDAAMDRFESRAFVFIFAVIANLHQFFTFN